MRDDEFPTHCTSCGVVNEAMVRLQLILKDLESANAQLRRQNSVLRGERNNQRSLSPFAEQAQEVFDYWCLRLSPNAREFGSKRFDAVVDRLEKGYTVSELKQAVDGCALKPYVTDSGRTASGTPSERQAELELICRSPAHVDRFKAYAETVPAERPKLSVVPSSDPIWNLCDCGHPMAEHIPPKLLSEREELRLVVPAWHSPCAHATCDCVDYDHFHQAAEEWLEGQRERARRDAERRERANLRERSA